MPCSKTPEPRPEKTKTACNACWPGLSQTLETPLRSSNLVLRYSLRDNPGEEVPPASRARRTPTKCLRPREPSRASVPAPCTAHSEAKPVQAGTACVRMFSPNKTAPHAQECLQDRPAEVVRPQTSFGFASIVADRSVPLARRPAQMPSTQEVDMEMKYRLPRS